MLSGDHQLVAPLFCGRALFSASNEPNTLARDLSYAVVGDGRRRGIARTRQSNLPGGPRLPAWWPAWRLAQLPVAWVPRLGVASSAGDVYQKF